VQSIDMNTPLSVVVRLCLVMVTLLGLCFIFLLGVLSIVRDLLVDEPDRARAPVNGSSRRSDVTPRNAAIEVSRTDASRPKRTAHGK
jgi:hypothetical protein